MSGGAEILAYNDFDKRSIRCLVTPWIAQSACLQIRYSKHQHEYEIKRNI